MLLAECDVWLINSAVEQATADVVHHHGYTEEDYWTPRTMPEVNGDSELLRQNTELRERLADLKDAIVRHEEHDKKLSFEVRRVQALLELQTEADKLDEVAILQRGLELAEELTDSQTSFVHFVSDDELTVEPVTWSRRTGDDYQQAIICDSYPVSEAGIWANALRERKPVVLNEYPVSGHTPPLPDGGTDLNRLVSVPVIEKGRIVMVVGIGGSSTEYTDLDVETVQLVSNEIWSIVQRCRVEEKKARFVRVIERSLNEIYTFDSETLHFTDVNLEARENLGYSIEELQRLTPLDLTPELSAESFARLVEPLRSGAREKIEFDTVHLRKDGTFSAVEVCLQLVDEDPPVFVAIISDITKRKQNEEALRNLNQRLRTSIDQMPIAYMLWDDKFRVLEWNPVAERIFGYSKSEMLGKDPLKYIVPEPVRPQVRQVISKLLAGGDVSFSEAGNNMRKDGAVISCHWYNTPLKDSAGATFAVLSMAIDVTERKRTEEELSRYEHIVSSTTDMLALLDEQYEYLAVNTAYLRAFNKEPDDVIGHTVSEVFGEEYFTDVVRPHAERCLAGERVRYQHWTLYPSTGRRYMDVFFTPYVGADSEILGFVVSARDNTAHKLDEEERERLAVAIEQTSESILITDRKARIQYVNPAFERTSGYQPEEVIGRNPRILKSGKHDKAFFEALWDTLLRGDSWRGRIINKKKNGDYYVQETVISPVRDDAGETINYVSVRRDITEELKLEEQLRQSQKMESIGLLAGGVAHDFNNMLGVIIGHSEIVLDEMGNTHPHYHELQEILAAAERSANLTRQLLAFARKQTISPRLLDLNETVEGMLKMLRRLIGESIEFAWVPGTGALQVMIDPSQIDQILVNLCVNARDAIKDIGKISIETNTVTLDAGDIEIRGDCAPGDYVLLTVSDDGIGMDRFTMERIFEPFFTSKDTGKSTGLGLSTIYGIVKQNNGFVSVYSEPGQGTTLMVYLPRYTGENIVMQKEQPVKSGCRGDETILLAEDEPALLDLITKILERLGYTVLAAPTPSEAIRLSETYEDEIQLLISDVVMPGMNGRDLADRLLSSRQNLKHLFISGYTADLIAHRGVLDEGVHFLQKPFSRLDLAARVREVLDGK